MEVYRVPSNSTDPYDLSVGLVNWDETNCIANLNPTPLYSKSPGVLGYYQDLLFTPANNSFPFSGGLTDLPIPYDPNDPNRLPLASPSSRPLLNNLPVFSYAEYLWSTVWVQPVVLNNTELSTTDLLGNGSNPGIVRTNWLLQSEPTAWPKLISTSPNPTPIEPDGSYFDLTANGAGIFTALSPVALGTPATIGSLPIAPTSNPPSTAVGHFYWTAYSPAYSSVGAGGLITRTWLAEGTGIQAPPVPADFMTYSQGASDTTDASSGWGFVPAQDTMVDKRLRNPDGSLAVPATATGGYRVTWFNATRSPSGNVVPPDFWVIALTPSTGTPVHFVVPANYPAQPNFPEAAVVTADTTQTLTSSILTDARWYIAPPNTPGGPDIYTAAWTDTALVAPGYCWFDVPADLRVPDPATLTVYAAKSILQNQPPAAAHPRPLNRPDWLDAVKTAVANISVQPGSGNQSLYHKIPFNFPWDIVVVNSEPTPTEPTTPSP
jgi:hypothetical protein